MLAAVALIACAVAQGPSTAEEWRERALVALENGPVDHAIVAFIESLELEDSPDARQHLAVLAHRWQHLRVTIRPPREPGDENAPALAAAAGRIVTGAKDLRVWDERSGEQLGDHIDLGLRVEEIHVGPAARVALVTLRGSDDLVAIDLETGEELWREAAAEEGSAWIVSWSQDGRRVLLVDHARMYQSGRPAVLEVRTGARLFDGRDHDFIATERSLSPDGRWLVGSIMRRLLGERVRWVPSRVDISTGEVSSLDVSAMEPWNFLWFSDDGTLVQSGEGIHLVHELAPDGTLRSTRALFAAPNSVGSPRSIRHDRASDRWTTLAGPTTVAQHGRDGAPAGRPLATCTFHGYGFDSHSAISRTGSYCSYVHPATGSVLVWDTVTGKRVGPAGERTGSLTWRQVFTSTPNLVTSSADGAVRIRSVVDRGESPARPPVSWYSSATPSRTPAEHGTLVKEPAFGVDVIGPDGQRVETYRTVHEPVAITISADGRRIAGSSGDGGAWWIDRTRPEAGVITLSEARTEPWINFDGHGDRIITEMWGSATVWRLSTASVEHRKAVEQVWGPGGFDARGEPHAVSGAALTSLAIPLAEGTVRMPGILLALERSGAARLWLDPSDRTVTWSCDYERTEGLWVPRSATIDPAQVAAGVDDLQWEVSGDRIAIAEGKTAVLLDARSGHVVGTTEMPDAIWAIRLIGDRLLVLSDLDGAWRSNELWRLLDAADGSLLAQHVQPDGSPTPSPIPGTSLIAVPYERATLRFEGLLEREGARWRKDDLDASVELTPIGSRTFLLESDEGPTFALDSASGVTVPTSDEAARSWPWARAVAAGERFAWLDRTGALVVVDAASSEVVFERRGPPTTRWSHPLAFACASADGRTIVHGRAVDEAGEGGYMAEMIDAATGESLRQFDGPPGDYSSARLDIAADALMAWSSEQLVVWRASTGEEIGRTRVEDFIEEVHAHPGGRRFTIDLGSDGFATWGPEDGPSPVGAHPGCWSNTRNFVHPTLPLACAVDAEGALLWYDLITLQQVPVDGVWSVRDVAADGRMIVDSDPRGADRILHRRVLAYEGGELRTTLMPWPGGESIGDGSATLVRPVEELRAEWEGRLRLTVTDEGEIVPLLRKR